MSQTSDSIRKKRKGHKTYFTRTNIALTYTFLRSPSNPTLILLYSFSNHPLIPD